MRQARRGLPPERKSQTWATFLSNHADEIWACDFVQTYDLFFRTIYAFFMVELGSRRVMPKCITRSPSDAWVTQQLREATPFGEGPRFLICDNDGKFGDQFERVAEGSGIDVIHTPVEAPKANAICERFIGSVRRELLDHILILSERHSLITSYIYPGCTRNLTTPFSFVLTGIVRRTSPFWSSSTISRAEFINPSRIIYDWYSYRLLT